MVAAIKKGFAFDESFQTETSKIVKDILEIPVENREWLTKENSNLANFYINKEQEHISKGNGFRIARTSIYDSVTATITKGHYQQRITDPILVHPENENIFSLFTPREIARINGLPDDYILPDAKTTSAEIIGQGVCYEAFNSVGKMIINHFNSEEFDEELVKLDLYKSTLSSVNNDVYSDEQLNCFMSGKLF